ncbi:MAG TPA: ABC transporter substrate-binding protein, partial [Myxococcales bacterium]|nr:ABC transporter substrate-binding protein [Myxococcales bacterium]
RAGMKAYLKLHGDTIAGRKVEILERDTTGPAPEVAKRVAQDLVAGDKVDFLAGFGMTPNALAVAPLATQSKTPMIVMNAASSVITTRSPYVARLSMTLPQVTAPMAQWAAKNGIRRVYSIVSDYAPGIDAETTFAKTFQAQGGEVVGSVRVPLKNPDFAPFVQRAKDARPQAVFIFVPAGEQGIAFVKAFTERGLREAGIKLIGSGDVVDDDVLEAMGDATLGVITTHHYSAAHDSPENAAFKKAYAEANGTGSRPNFMAVAGYDGMAAIYAVAKKLDGKIDADQAMAALKGLALQSPRGPIHIDPETRDIVQTVYVRKVERTKAGLYNVEFDRFADVKDPGK